MTQIEHPASIPSITPPIKTVEDLSTSVILDNPEKAEQFHRYIQEKF